MNSDCCIGLLRRRPWARPTFIAALCVSLVLSFAYVRLTEAFAVVRWAVVPGVAGSVLLYGWIIRQTLLSGDPCRVRGGS